MMYQTNGLQVRLLPLGRKYPCLEVLSYCNGETLLFKMALLDKNTRLFVHMN